MHKQIRKLRHWKQRFNRNAEFIFRRRVNWGTKIYEPGDLIPKELQDNPTKLRRFWESHTVELAEFDVPNVATGQVEDVQPPKGVTVDEVGKGFLVTDTDGTEHRVNGRGALNELLRWITLEHETAQVEALEDFDDRWLDGGDDLLVVTNGSDAPEL